MVGNHHPLLDKLLRYQYPSTPTIHLPFPQDLMVKNIKRYQKQVKREGGTAAELDIIPATYVLPQVGGQEAAGGAWRSRVGWGGVRWHVWGAGAEDAQCMDAGSGCMAVKCWVPRADVKPMP